MHMHMFGVALPSPPAQLFMVLAVLIGALYVTLESVNMFVQATQSRRSLGLLANGMEKKVFFGFTFLECACTPVPRRFAPFHSLGVISGMCILVPFTLHPSPEVIGCHELSRMSWPLYIRLLSLAIARPAFFTHMHTHVRPHVCN